MIYGNGLQQNLTGQNRSAVINNRYGCIGVTWEEKANGAQARFKRRANPDAICGFFRRHRRIRLILWLTDHPQSIHEHRR